MDVLQVMILSIESVTLEITKELLMNIAIIHAIIGSNNCLHFWNDYL